MEKQLELLISICMYCRKITGCTMSGSVVMIRTECIDCPKDGSCAVVANYELFNLSHGVCRNCLTYYSGGEC
jgi:hypothetical protein